MTISTVGYGDVVPANNGERVFVIASLLVGTSFFSYIVGSVCGVLAKLSERQTEFQDKMSELNVFIRDAQIKQPLATRLRGFFRYQYNTSSESNWLELLQELTPALRGAVAMEMHSGWRALAAAAPVTSHPVPPLSLSLSVSLNRSLCNAASLLTRLTGSPPPAAPSRVSPPRTRRLNELNVFHEAPINMIIRLTLAFTVRPKPR